MKRLLGLGLALVLVGPVQADIRERLAWWVEWRNRRLEERGRRPEVRRTPGRPTPSRSRLPHAPIEPGRYRFESGFGWRGRKHHDGVDLSAPTGTPVRAMADAVVTEARWRRGYGYTVVLDHGRGLTSRYAHLYRPPFVRVGEEVDGGRTIGGVGSTGRATGAHLHLEVHEWGRAVDPQRFRDF